MTHLTEAMLISLRDDCPGDSDRMAEAGGAREHLRDCPDCRRALEDRKRQRSAAGKALAALDDAFDVEEARAAVRSRMQAASTQGSTRPAGRRASRAGPARIGGGALARAAGLVLVAAVGVSALPGSPVRSWIAARTGSEGIAVDPAPTVTPARTATPSEPAGIRVTVQAPLTVRLSGLAAGEQVSLMWVPGSEVAIFAESGSRFDASQDGVEATVSRGPVRLELPLGVRPLTLEVGGRPWIRHVQVGTEYLVAPEVPNGQPLRFVVPEPGGG